MSDQTMPSTPGPWPWPPDTDPSLASINNVGINDMQPLSPPAQPVQPVQPQPLNWPSPPQQPQPAPVLPPVVAAPVAPPSIEATVLGKLVAIERDFRELKNAALKVTVPDSEQLTRIEGQLSDVKETLNYLLNRVG